MAQASHRRLATIALSKTLPDKFIIEYAQFVARLITFSSYLPIINLPLNCMFTPNILQLIFLQLFHLRLSITHYIGRLLEYTVQLQTTSFAYRCKTLLQCLKVYSSPLQGYLITIINYLQKIMPSVLYAQSLFLSWFLEEMSLGMRCIKQTTLVMTTPLLLPLSEVDRV